MKISSESEDFAEALYFEKAREIYKNVEKEVQTRKFISHEETAQADFSIRIEATAKMVEARIEAYLLVYEKENKLIDDKDKAEIFERINKIIKQQCQLLFSGSHGTITIVRNQWSDSYTSQMKEYFDNKVRVLMEPALLKFNIKTREMELNKMLEQNKAKQYEILRWIFDKVSGQQYKAAYLSELITNDSEYTEKDLTKVSDYLTGESLINQLDDSGLLVQLTHKGIIEIQNSVNNPQRATEHFSSTIINNYISGNNYGGINQQTGVNNTQINSSSSINEIEEKINELVEAVKNSSLSEVQKITVENDLQTIQKLTRVENSPEVKQVVSDRITGVKDVLSTTADLVSLGQVILPMIAYFFHIAAR